MSIESVSNGNMTYQGSSSISESGRTSVTQSQTGNSNETAGNVADVVNLSTSGRNMQNIASTGQEEEKKAANSQIKSAVDNINKSSASTEAIFGIHDGTNRVTIKIVDKDTKKVIKEYPPEKTLDMIEKVWELAGLMVDEKR